MKISPAFAVGVAIVGLAVGGAVACDPGDNTPGHDTVSESPQDSEPPPAHKATGPATSFREGTFLVGTDIKTGTYKTAGPGRGDTFNVGCYWQRSRDDSGELNSIIANEIVSGPGRVTVKPGEVFKTTGNCQWRLVA